MKWAGLLMLALVAFMPLTRAGFVWEDRTWQHGIEQPLSRSRPLMRLSWWLQTRYTPSPQAFHALNVVLHMTLAALVGLLVLRLGLSSSSAWLTGAIALLHPMTMESVAYLSSRTELFAAIGVVGACILAVRAQGGRWALVMMALVFGLAGKESAITGLLLVPLTLWAVGRQRAAYLTLVIGMSAGVIGLLWFAQVQGTSLAGLVNHGEAGGMQTDALSWLLIQSTAAVRLTWLSLWPFFGGFTPDYDYDAVSLLLRHGALLTLFALSVLAWRLRQTHPLVTFGLTWMLLAILPRLIVQTPRSILNEHQYLLPFLGLVIAGVAAGEKPALFTGTLSATLRHIPGQDKYAAKLWVQG